jgi:hypothetical protein
MNQPLSAMKWRSPRRVVPGRRQVFSQQPAGMCGKRILAP